MVAKSYGPQFTPVTKTALPDIQAPVQQQPKPTGKTEFQKILEQQSARENAIQFSNHAAKRLEQREISLSPEDLTRLASAVDRAAGKGARESLVLLDDLALIVSVSNRKVITAIGTEAMRENVVTNIDSAVIA